MHYLRWMLCLAVFFLNTAFSGLNGLLAQKSEPSEVSGVIKDKTSSETLPYANIVVKGTVNGTVSDLNGEFRLGNLRAGDYTLQVSYTGYSTQEIEVSLKAGEKKRLAISLDQPIIALGEVVVSSQRLGQNAVIN